MLAPAISLSEQLEKLGAYAGAAAFFGLAVLTILYFAQARELKRLRDWAGRAPERAHELESRIVAEAEARRVRAEPIRRPAAAQTAAGATAAGASAPAAAAATGATPATATAPAASTAAAPVASDTAPEAVAAASGTPSETGGIEAGSEAAAAASGAASEAAKAAQAKPGEVAAKEAAAAASGEAEPAEVAAGGPAEKEAAPAAVGDGAKLGERPVPAAAAAAPAAAAASPAGATPGPAVGRPSSGLTDETGEEEPVTANGTPGEIPAVPRATPAPFTPRRPAPAGLRAAQPSTAPRRPPAPPPSRRATADKRSRSALAGLAGGVLIGLVALVFAALQLFGGEESKPPPNTLATETPVPAAQTPAPEGRAVAPAPERAETTVAVLNGTTFTGLAATVSDRLVAAGFTKGKTDNFSDQARSASFIFYADDDAARRSAREISKILKISDVQPIDSDTQALAEGADVVVVVGADQTP